MLQGGGGIDKCIHSCFENLQRHTASAKNEDIKNAIGHYTQDTQATKGKQQQTISLLNASQTLVDTVTDITTNVYYFHYEKIFHTIIKTSKIKPPATTSTKIRIKISLPLLAKKTLSIYLFHALVLEYGDTQLTMLSTTTLQLH